MAKVAAKAKDRPVKKKQTVGMKILTILFSIVSVFYVAPVFIVLMNSFKSNAAISRFGRLGGPAALKPPPAIASVGPNKSLPSTACPERFRRPNAGANVLSICAHGIRFANTASGWRRSII